MNILILGGTRFVGRHIVSAFLDAGHQVSVLTRGTATADLPEQVEHLQGDRNEGAAGLQALNGRTWDACVDVSGYTPLQVQASAELLAGQVGQYVFISTASVYAEPGRHPVRESDPLLPPTAHDCTEVNGQTYGPLKVACEQIVQATYGERCALLRPQIIVGPYDYTLRYPYWVDRAARGGTVLAGAAEAHLQVIDADDLARFTVQVVEQRLSGPFNVSGPRLTWPAFLETLGAKDVCWASAAQLAAAHASFDDLPIYLPDDHEQSGLMDMDHSRASAHGLTLTDPATTARKTQAWSEGAGLTYALTPEREAEIVTAVQAQQSS